jgi:hypothetical protein
MTRREAILRASAVLGGTALIGQAAMLAGCGRQQAAAPEAGTNADDGTARQQGLFSDAELELLAEIAETILPETATPGAKAAGVGPFIAVMVSDCYSPEEQATFRAGLATIDRVCRELHGDRFVGLSPDERLATAERLDREQFDAMQNRGDESAHYFRMLKELTVLGYFTSELAYQSVLEYAETPGRYETCRDFDPDVRMQAGHASSIFNT